jgi:C4-type Zn-finger protein
MVEKLVVRLLLAAFMEVMISINAKIPNAIMATVMAVRNLLPEILRQESATVSLKVIGLFIQPKVNN